MSRIIRRWILCAVPIDADLGDIESHLDDMKTPFGRISGVSEVTFFGRDPDGFRERALIIKKKKVEFLAQQYTTMADSFGGTADPARLGEKVLSDIMRQRCSSGLTFLVNLVDNIRGSQGDEAMIFNELDGSSSLLDEALLANILNNGLEVALVKARFNPTPRRRR